MNIFKKISEISDDLNNPNKTVAMSLATYKLLNDKGRGINAKVVIFDEIPFEESLSFINVKEG